MRTDNNEKKGMLSVVPGIVLIIVLICILITNSVISSNMIENQGLQNLNLSANRASSELHKSFHRQQDSLETMAHMTAHLMQHERIDTDSLKHLTEKSSFDGIEYIHPTGHSIDMDGQMRDVSSKPYFKNALKKKSGYSYDYAPERGSNGTLIFYAPIVSDKGKYYGSLIGYFNKETMDSMLDTSFWGSDARQFLCSTDGTIVASNIITGHSRTIEEYFLKSTDEDISGNSTLTKSLKEMKGTFSIEYRGQKEVGTVSMLGNKEFMLVETFPNDMISQMYAPVQKTTQAAIICVLLCLIAYGIAFFLINTRRRKRLEEANLKANRLLKGVQGLFEYSFLVDYEQGEFELLESKQYNMSDVPLKGRCADYEEPLKVIFLDGDPERPMLEYMSYEYVASKLQEGVESITMEFNSAEDRFSWHEMHIICLERRDGRPVKVLLAIVDISAFKRKQSFRKKITEILYGKTYDLIGQIDASRGVLIIEDAKIPSSVFRVNEEITYQTLINKEANYNVPQDERAEYLRKVSLETILEELERQEHYCATVNHYNKKGELRILEYHFAYYNREEQKLIWAMEDVTRNVDSDPLTGALTLDGFTRKVSYLLHHNQEKEQFTILHFDIKEFKAVNTLMGYRFGNELLVKTVREIRASGLHPLEVARGTADHFYCIIRTEDLNYDEIGKLCRICLDNETQSFAARLYCGIYNIEDEEEYVRTMCDKARLACSKIESGYIMPYIRYRADMQRSYIETTEILNSFDRALNEHQFKVWYQPIFDAQTKEIASAEALVRWEHPQKGMIPPAIFIPALEEKGYVSGLDMYVENQLQIMMSNRLLAGKKAVPVSMNLSRIDFMDQHMIMNLLNNLENLPFDRYYTRFEITESAFVNISDREREVINTLRSLGSRILMDDFGTGYSSLACMADESFDIIKLDMSFVRKIGQSRNAEAVISNVIRMSHEINAQVIAEGVETDEQYSFLKAKDCDFIQGYYFSRPLPQYEFELLLDEDGLQAK